MSWNLIDVWARLAIQPDPASSAGGAEIAGPSEPNDCFEGLVSVLGPCVPLCCGRQFG